MGICIADFNCDNKCLQLQSSQLKGKIPKKTAFLQTLLANLKSHRPSVLLNSRVTNLVVLAIALLS